MLVIEFYVGIRYFKKCITIQIYDLRKLNTSYAHTKALWKEIHLIQKGFILQTFICTKYVMIQVLYVLALNYPWCFYISAFGIIPLTLPRVYNLFSIFRYKNRRRHVHSYWNGNEHG